MSRINKKNGRRNISFESDCWEKVTILNELLDYNPPYAKIIKQAVNNLFEKEMKQNQEIKIEWERRKKDKKRSKVVSLNKNKGNGQ